MWRRAGASGAGPAHRRGAAGRHVASAAAGPSGRPPAPVRRPLGARSGPRPAAAAPERAEGAGRPDGGERGPDAGPTGAPLAPDADSRLPEVPPSRDRLAALLRAKRAERAGEPAPGAPGAVYLVGTGPGDPGLLTLRALRLMRTADVVLYDRLISRDVLDLCGPDAVLVYVGKRKGLHTVAQEEIHELLLNFARAGATVVRLKGGDPYVFGRGGEEMDYLQARGIRVHCVPGITAASGISAELGIPLTHRGLADSVKFLTGHLRGDGEELPEDVGRRAAQELTTLVVYMGLTTLPKLRADLVKHGADPRVPAAAIERGTTPEQRTVLAPLEDLPAAVADAGLESPTLLVIGRVVALSPLWTGAPRLCEAGDLHRAPAYYQDFDAEDLGTGGRNKLGEAGLPR